MTAPPQPTLFDDPGAEEPDRTGLTAEQERAVDARTGSRLLHAGAGSGKTTVVVERFALAVADDGLDPRRILAITFTKKAAGELRQRLRERLAELGHRAAALAAEGAQVSTVHGFCAGLLRGHALAAGVDPGFRVLDEPEAARLRSAAFEAAFAVLLEGPSAADAEPAPARDDALELAAAYRPDRLFRLIDATYAQLRSRGQTEPALPAVPPRPAPEAERARLAAARDAAAARLAGERDGALVERARVALDRCERILAALRPGELPAPGELEPATFTTGNARALACAECCEYLEALAAYRRAAADAQAAGAVALLDRLLRSYGREYAARKRARSGLDFDDLELLVRDLLRDRPDVRTAVASRFALVMVDEFQDTNARQLELLELLERDNLLTVGDERQAIYGFRHADVEIFRRRRAHLAGHDGVDALAANFRSRAPILAALDAAFAPVFGAGFVPLRPGRADAHDVPGPLVEVLVSAEAEWAPEAERLGDTLPPAPAGRRAEARLLARRVRELVDSGATRAGDVAVLVRSAASIGLFERALEDAGLATHVAGGRGYWSDQQVHDLLAYLTALANPREELALFELLASPLVGIGSDGLAILAATRRELDRDAWWALEEAFCPRPGAPEVEAAPEGEGEALAAALPPADAERLRAFCPWFAAERRAAARHGLDELVERAVVARDYDLHVLRLRGGERRLANVRKLARLARDYERREGRDLRGFLDHAAVTAAAEPIEGDAPVEAEGLDAVRLMTIHAAKGLEFGVVCVADLGRTGPGDHPDLLVGEDGRVGLRLVSLDGNGGVPALDYEALHDERVAAEEEEERRVFYVALTRARERLIASGTIPAVEDWPAPRPAGAPIAWLAPALAPGIADTLRERTSEWEAPPGVLCRLSTPATVGAVLAEDALAPAPGEPPPPPDAAPAHPAAAAKAPGGPEGAEARVQAPPDGPAAAKPRVRALSYSGLESYAQCPYRFYLERVLRLPAISPPPAAPEEEPGGLPPLLRGTLAHALLERLDFPAPAEPDVAAVAAELSIALTDVAAEDLRALVAAFVASPLCTRLAEATAVRREAPFAFPLAGVLVNGVVDVIAREGERALVVDYKTDRLEPDEDVERRTAHDYGVQRLVYALAALRDGAREVEVAHCFLEQAGAPASAVYAQADVPRLERELTALARGALAGEFPVTAEPHRQLCGTCPGRPALCSHPEELTLRDDPRARARAG